MTLDELEWRPFGDLEHHWWTAQVGPRGAVAHNRATGRYCVYRFHVDTDTREFSPDHRPASATIAYSEIGIEDPLTVQCLLFEITNDTQEVTDEHSHQ